MHTCAVDGMCATACPVLINTGLLVKSCGARRRRRRRPRRVDDPSKHWKGTTGTFSTVMGITDALPGPLEVALTGVNEAARWVLGQDNIPLWSDELPGGGASPAATRSPRARWPRSTSRRA